MPRHARASATRWTHTLVALALIFSCTPSPELPSDPAVQRPAALAAAPGWTPTGSMNQGRHGHTATVLPNGKVLVAGGNAFPGDLASAEVYDPSSGTWTATGSMAQARTSHTATLLPDGKVLVTGGSSGSQYLASAEVYDPITGTWTATSPLAGPRFGHTATLLPTGRVLIGGGASIDSWLNDFFELYDPATGTWTLTQPRESRTRHTATLLANGKVLVVGGEGFYSGSLASAEIYDPVSRRWTATGSLAQVRYGHEATLLADGKVLVTGGSGRSGFLTSAEVYDPVTGQWTATGPMTIARPNHTATLLPDGRVLIAGGTHSFSVASSVEAYEPKTGAWTSLLPLIWDRNGHTATLLPGGKVLIAGGYGDSSPGALARAEVYDATTGDWAATRSLTRARVDPTATLLPQGKVLVAGGDFNNTPVAQVEVYDPADGTWTSTMSLGQARSRHTATLLPQGKVLVVGGHGNTHALAHAELYDSSAGTWAPTAPLFQARESHTATLLLDGKVLVTGGLGGSSSLTTAELYDPATGTWAPTGPMAQARAHHTATLLPGGKVLVVGGLDATGFLASAEVYDPATGTWTASDSLAQASAHHTATLLPDGKVLIAGGDFNGTPLTRSELYDPATGTWASSNALAQGRENHTATLLPDGRVLVTGGTSLASAEVYTPATGTWSAARSPAQARSHHTATLLPDGKVLVAAGHFNGTPLSGVELYDPVTGGWSLTSSMAQPRASHTATLLPDGKVLVTGGSGNGYLSIAELYDPATGTWTSTGAMTQARASHQALLLPNGKVLAVGGYGSTGTLATAELYDPTTGTWTPTGSLTEARSVPTVTLLRNGKVLVAGGYANWTSLSSAELYDPATGTWAPTGSMIQGRDSHTATLLPNGKVLVAGGSGAPGSAELYDPATGTWAPTGAMFQGRLSHTATLLPDGKVLIVGGEASWNLLSGAELYDPATGTWAATGPLTHARSDHKATLMLDGKVLVAGGQDLDSGSLAVSNTELYDPATGTWAPMGPMARKRISHTVTLLLDGRVLAVGGSDYFEVSTAEVYSPHGATPAWRPDIASVSPSASLATGNVFTVNGSGFRGLSEASSGTTSSSSSDVPLLTLRDLSRDRMLAVSFQDFSSTHVSASVPQVPPGQYLLAVTVNGRTATTVLAINVAPDTTPPAVALTSPAEGERLSGTVTFTATASDTEDVTQVAFFVGTTQVGTSTSAPYSFTYDTRLMPNGAKVLTARAYDVANNVATSVPVNVTFDNDFMPPTVALTSPATGATLMGTVTLSATASDNVAVTRVEFYDGATLLRTITSTPYSFSWDSRTVANGSHVLTAKAYDVAGQSTTSTAVTVTVDNDELPPTVAFSAPAAGATLTGTLTLSATASDNVAVTRVEFYDGTTRLITDTTSPYSYSWNTLSAANGEHTLTAQAYDARGNVGIATVTVTVDNDLTPPTVALTAPTEGATVSGTLTLMASASDNKAVTRVAFFVGTTQVGTDSSAPYSYAYNTRLLSNGPRVLTAKAYDAANNVATSTAVNVTFDNDFTPPTVTLTAPGEGETLTGSVTFTATASDASGISKVAFFVGSTQVGTDSTAPYSFAYNTRLQANGAKVLTAKAYDTLNNVASSASVNVTFDNDLSPPTVALTAPAEGETLTGSVTFTASASDASGISKVVFFAGSIQLGVATTAPYSITYNTRTLTNGAKALTAKAYDTFNTMATSAAVNVTIDNDLTAPTTSLTSPTAGSTVSGTVQLQAIASDDRGTVTKVDFYQGSLLLGSVTSAPFTWTWDTTKAPLGNNILKTRAWDAAGNSAYSPNVTVTVTR